jgi:hypothetical protein
MNAGTAVSRELADRMRDVLTLVASGRLSEAETMRSLERLVDAGNIPVLPAMRLVDVQLAEVPGGHPLMRALVDLEGLQIYEIPYYVGKNGKPYGDSFRAESGNDGLDLLMRDVVLAHVRVNPVMTEDEQRRMRLGISRWIAVNVTPRVVRAHERWEREQVAAENVAKSVSKPRP